jgi:hypothetical protein
MRKPDWLIDGLMCDEGWVGRRLTGGSTGSFVFVSWRIAIYANANANGSETMLITLTLPGF